MFKDAPDLLTRKQVQDLLQVSKNTILEFINKGNLPAFMLAGSYRIYKKDLIEFVMSSYHYDKIF